MTFFTGKYLALAAKNLALSCTGALVLAACSAAPPAASAPEDGPPKTQTNLADSFGKVIGLDPALVAVIDPAAPVEKLADGFWWSEGPAWDKARGQLYFSDVPQNKVYTWSAGQGLKTFLDPSGIDPAELTDSAAAQRGDLGVNGMVPARGGGLLLANHGRQSLERLDLETLVRETLSAEFKGRPYNSPNDIIEARGGDIYFTDPPYGLKDQDNSKLPKQPVNGVYRLTPSGEVSLIDGALSRPNGIALSPDEAFLYVSNSDAKAAIIMRYSALPDGGYGHGEIWHDAQADLDSGLNGLPDGMTVAADGTVYATGPGGVLILSPSGTLLGRIQIGLDPKGKATANCTLGGPQGKTLFMTSHDTLARIRVKSGL